MIVMAEREKSYMPQGTAGLIRYFDSDKGLKLKPHYVVFTTVAFTSLVLLMKFLAK